IQVNFSEPVTVNTSSGTPTLALTSGGQALYTGGSGSTTLTFSYTVAAGQNSADLDYTSTSALALNNATIQDAAGNNALLALPASGSDGLAAQDILIDTVAPVVSSVSTSTASGAYNQDKSVFIQVNFSEPVTVNTSSGT